jgi:N-acetyl sugar amidotransferase
VMDNTDPDIVFDESGICSYCNLYPSRKKTFVPDKEQGKKLLTELVENCKKAGEGKKYDCVIGVSGGVDSTYVAWLVKNLGLRPLAVHLDNGWNSELAITNIRAVLAKLDIDLHTYVIDWEEFRDLQLAFLKASTPDSEIPSDHAIVALMREIANKENIPVIWGVNFSSEAILPPAWSQGHMDWTYIKNVSRKFGTKSLRHYPHYSIWKLIYYNRIRRQKLYNILNYIDYDKQEAKVMLEREIGWRDYGGKHYESVYTRIFQSYILPVKFGYDKRKAHYSSLILAGQMSRPDALELLKEPLFDPLTVGKDIEFLTKKLQISSEEFDFIMNAPKKTYHDYRSKWPDTVKMLEKSFFNFLIGIKRKLKF